MNVPHVRLDEAIEYIRGITFKPEDVIAMDSDGAVACMRTKNIQRALDESDLIAVPSAFVRREELYLRPGDVLISSANSWNLVGKVVLVPELNYLATAGGFIGIVRAKEEVVDARFLFHWLNADATQAKIRNCGRQTTNISNLSSKQFLDLVMPRPPLAEQQRRAIILDKADNLRSKRQEAIRLANEFRRAIFLDMFGDPVSNPKGWPVFKMGDVIDFKGGSQPPKETFFDAPKPGYVRLVQIRDFKSDRYKTYIPEQLAKRAFDVDDVMIARYGPPVFQILRGLSGSYNVALMKAQPKADILKEIIYWLLQLPAYHDVVVANSERTAGQSGVNLELLNKLLVPLPPRNVQVEIAKRTTAITALIRKQEEMLRSQDEQYAALQATLLA